MPSPITQLLDHTLIFEAAGIAQGMRVGDFGCGNSGHFVFAAARMVGDSGMVYAVDILKDALSAIKSRADFDNIQNVTTVWSNLEIFGATTIPDGSLDLGLLLSVLHQSEKNADIIRESARMLKAQGRLVIVDWKRTASPLGPAVERRPDPEELVGIARKLGFDLIKSFQPGDYHFGLLFQKR